jgi:hexokinase
VAAGLRGTLRSIEAELATSHAIAVDGSLYEGYSGFDAMLHLTFVELSGLERAGRLRLVFATDSISAGAAVIAMAAAAPIGHCGSTRHDTRCPLALARSRCSAPR